MNLSSIWVINPIILTNIRSPQLKFQQGIIISHYYFLYNLCIFIKKKKVDLIIIISLLFTLFLLKS